jgi:hypothetical protein
MKEWKVSSIPQQSKAIKQKNKTKQNKNNQIATKNGIFQEIYHERLIRGYTCACMCSHEQAVRSKS